MDLFSTNHPVTTDVDISSHAFWDQSFDDREKSFAQLRATAPVSWHPPTEVPHQARRGEGGPAPDAVRRICTGLTALAAAAWPHAAHLYEGSNFDWSDFDPGLLDDVRPAFPKLPPAAVALALRIRAHLHGFVSL